VTDTIKGGTWQDGRFVRESAPPPPTETPETPWSKYVGLMVLLAVTAFVVRATGWWGLVMVAGLLVSIVLHECGHYFAARQAGMKVTEFFVGFGPRLVSWRRGEVEYGVKVAPIGAYVRIIGMNDLEDVEAADEGRTYREKSYWARLRVVLAGPAVNLLLGFLILAIIPMTIGEQSNKGWSVGATSRGSAAAAAHIRVHDVLVSIDGKSAADFDNSAAKVIASHAGDDVPIVVRRDGKLITLHATIGWHLTSDVQDSLAPLAAGDTLTKVGSTKVTTFDQARQALAAAASGHATVEFVRDGDLYRTSVSTPVHLSAKDGQGFLGIAASPAFERVGPLKAVTTAASDFGGMVSASVSGLTHFFSPSGLTNWTKLVVNPDATSTTAGRPVAPVVALTHGAPSADSNEPLPANSPQNDRISSIFGIVRLGGQAGQAGVATLLLVLALINIFLGLLNLIPLPPFDGGHAAVATYEAIRERLSGRPYRADMTKLIPVTYAVVALFGFIFLSSSYLDLFHPARNPFNSP
jgi:RIP metalloprotease RseP